MITLDVYKPEPGDVLIFHVETGHVPVQKAEPFLSKIRERLSSMFPNTKILVAAMIDGNRSVTVDVVRGQEASEQIKGEKNENKTSDSSDGSDSPERMQSVQG